MIKNLIKIRNALILIVICFFLTGCLDIEYHLQIKPDGTESITCKVGMPAFLAGQSGEIAKSLEDQGYKVAIEAQGDKYYVIGTRVSPKNQWLLPYPVGLVKEKVIFEPTYLNIWVVKRYSMKAQYTLDRDEVNKLISEFAQNIYTQNIRIPFRYVIAVPGKISKYNSDEISGNSLVWKYTIRPNEKIDIELASNDINYPAIIIILIILFAGGSYSILRKSRNKVTEIQENIGTKQTLEEEKSLREREEAEKRREEEKQRKEKSMSRFSNQEEYEKWKAGRLREMDKKAG